MKDILVRAKVAPLEKKNSCCKSCGDTGCEIYKHALTTESFKFFSNQRKYCIKLFIFTGLTHYIYCCPLISTIILRVLTILLFTLIANISTVIISSSIIIVTIIIFLIYLFHLKFICLFILFFYFLFIYLLILGPIWTEESPFGRFFNPGMLRVEGVEVLELISITPQYNPVVSA